MSDPSLHRVLGRRAPVVTLLVLALTSAGAAQSPETYRTRVDRLEERLRQIGQERAPSRGGDSLPVDLDTLWVGPVRLLAPDAGRNFVQVVANRLRDSLDIVVGGDTSYLPAVTYVVLPRGRGGGARRWEGGQVWWYMEREMPGREPDTPDEVASNLLGDLRQRVLASLGWTTRQWLDHYWVPLDTLTQTQAATVYLELATKPWSAVVRCYAGELDRCRIALALDAGAPEAWYTAAERRHLVTSAMASYGDVQRDLRAQRCASAADEQACLQTLAAYPALVDEPLSPMARQTLVRVAFEAGGAGAFGRFVRGDSLALPERLAYAAGLPVDSLVARWRDEIIAARPSGTVLSRLGGWTAFFWVVVLSVAAMRSTRWRIR